jgi:hypothetical protein
MTEEERHQALQGLLKSQVWLEVIEPAYKQRLGIELQALIETGEDTHRGAFQIFKEALSPRVKPISTAVRRGRIRAIQDLLAWPREEVVQKELDVVRKKAHNEEHERLVHYANWGRYSPVSPPAYPDFEGDS